MWTKMAKGESDRRHRVPNYFSNWRQLLVGIRGTGRLTLKLSPPPYPSLIFDDPNCPNETTQASIIYCHQKMLSFSFPISPTKIQKEDMKFISHPN